MRRVGLLLVPVVVIAAAIGWGPAVLTARLDAALSWATGHPVTIRGGVRLGWSGGPSVQIRDLGVANAAWGSRPDMLTVPLMTVTIGWPALLRGEVAIDSVRVERPDLLLERQADGHGNWEVAGATKPSSGGSDVATAPVLRWSTISVSDGHLTVHDGVTGRSLTATLEGTGQHSGVAVSGRIMLPDPLDMTATMEPGQAGLSVTGRVSGQGSEGTASGVLDPATWMPIGPVTVDATLAAGGALAARYQVPAPASLHVLVRREGDALSFRDIRVALPAGEIGGGLDLGLTDPVTLRGALSSQRLDLLALLPPPAPPDHSSAPVAASPAPPVTARVPWWLGALNADLRATIAELHEGDIVLRDVSGHLVLRDGHLSLDPVTGTGPGGSFAMTGQGDVRAAPPSVAVTLHAPALAVQPLLQWAGLPSDISGTASFDADLRTTGLNKPEWLAGLSGRASVGMADGDIDLQGLGSVLADAHLPIDLRGRAHLRCLLLRAEIANGVANLSPLLLDATSLLIQGTGEVDLVRQTLALRLRPLLRTGPGLVVPVTLRGPWARPKLDVDPGGLVGVIEGLTKPGSDPCRAAGLVSKVPAPSSKPLKPADLLRSLLR